ncbi:hypothetical protein GCM10027167_62060 [Nocardia heshunensis]
MRISAATPSAINTSSAVRIACAEGVRGNNPGASEIMVPPAIAALVPTRGTRNMDDPNRIRDLPGSPAEPSVIPACSWPESNAVGWIPAKSPPG